MIRRFYLVYPDSKRNDLMVATNVDLGLMGRNEIIYGDFIIDADKLGANMTVDDGCEGDVLASRYSFLTVSERVKNILQIILADTVQWIPITTRRSTMLHTDNKYYILNPLVKCDALATVPTETSIFNMKLKPDSIAANLLCFRVVNEESLVFMTDKCTEMLMGNELQGIVRFEIRSA